MKTIELTLEELRKVQCFLKVSDNFREQIYKDILNLYSSQDINSIEVNDKWFKSLEKAIDKILSY